MASPLYDQLHIDHSKRIGDSVAAATTNGKVWTSVLRDNHLNEACRRLMSKYWIKTRKEGESSDAWDFFRSLIASEGQAMTANSIALSSYTGGVYEIISVLNGTTVVKEQPQGWVDDISLIPWYDSATTNQYYKLQAGNLVNTGGGATDTMTLRYIKNWTNLTAAYASDIPVPSRYFHQILDLAYKVAMEEYHGEQSLEVALAKEAFVDKETNA